MEAGWERGFSEANMDLGGSDVAALSPAIPACIIEEVVVVLELGKRAAFPTFPAFPSLWCVWSAAESSWFSAQP